MLGLSTRPSAVCAIAALGLLHIRALAKDEARTPSSIRHALADSDAPVEAVAAGLANDSCAAPTAISGAGPFAFNNSNFNTDGPTHTACDVYGDGQVQVDHDEWFCWTAPASVCPSGYVVEDCGRTAVDTRIAVYSGCGCPTDSTRLLGCGDDECGETLQTQVPFQPAANQSYLIRVGTYPGQAGGPGSFMVRCDTPPPCTQPASNCRTRNQFDAFVSDRTKFLVADDFSPAASGGVTSVCWWGAYLSDADLNCQGAAPDSFQIRYFADSGGLPGALLNTFSQAGGTLAVTGPVATDQLIADTVPEYAYTATHAAVAVTAGQRYWIEISNSITGCGWYWETAFPGDERAVQDGTDTTPPDGYTNADLILDDLAFCLNVPLASPPMNDQCVNSTVISGVGNFSFDSRFATTDGPPHTRCDVQTNGNDQVAHDQWFCWTSPCTDTIFVRTCGLTQVDTRIAVYQGCLCPPTDGNLVVCDDDLCGAPLGLQTMVRFPATAGQAYMIRVGTFPPEVGGEGQFNISCGPPDHAGCPGTGSCCAARAAPGCCDTPCCETVCACDPYCCTTQWDETCATIGFFGTGCGAAVLCGGCDSVCGDPCAGSCCRDNNAPGCSDTACCEQVCACDPYCCDTEWDQTCAGTGFVPGCGAAAMCGDLCIPQCPVGTVTFVDPPSSTLDARRPHLPQNAAALQGISSVRVSVPAGAELADCWTLCESTGTPGNSIASVVPNGDGTVAVNLAQPLKAGAVTRISYTDDLGTTATGAFVSHPSNANGDATASAADVSALLAELQGTPTLPPGIYRRDIDHSGKFSGADLLEAVDLLNGAGAFTPWMGTPLPTASGACPQ